MTVVSASGKVRQNDRLNLQVLGSLGADTFMQTSCLKVCWYIFLFPSYDFVLQIFFSFNSPTGREKMMVINTPRHT